MLEAQTMPHRDWLRWNERRHELMVGWEEWFETHDLLLCPAARQYDDLTCLHMAGLIEEGLLPLHVAARALKSPATMTRRPGFDPGPRPVGAGVDRIDGAYSDHPRARPGRDPTGSPMTGRFVRSPRSPTPDAPPFT